jgi:hypothetical protein
MYKHAVAVTGYLKAGHSTSTGAKFLRGSWPINAMDLEESLPSLPAKRHTPSICVALLSSRHYIMSRYSFASAEATAS